MTKVIGGLLDVSVNGIPLRPKGDWTFEGIGGFKQESISDQNGLAGFKRNRVPGMTKGKATNDGVWDLDDLFNVVNGTVTVTLADGVSGYVMENATFTGEPMLGSEEGEIDVQFEGTGWTPIGA